jgi:hypothetical protein
MAGQRVYRSMDAKIWEHQGLVLDKPGHRRRIRQQEPMPMWW